MELRSHKLWCSQKGKESKPSPPSHEDTRCHPQASQGPSRRPSRPVQTLFPCGVLCPSSWGTRAPDRLGAEPKLVPNLSWKTTTLRCLPMSRDTRAKAGQCPTDPGHEPAPSGPRHQGAKTHTELLAQSSASGRRRWRPRQATLTIPRPFRTFV